MRLSSCLLIFLFLAPLAARPVRPIIPPELPDPAPSPWLRMNQRAGMIFAGSVLRVERVRPTHLREVETIEIWFHVDHAIRGVRTGQNLSIREWAGLWVARPRYRVGERVVLFLYPESRLGLTSPVAANSGRFSVNAQGRVGFTPAQAVWLGHERVLPRTRINDGIPLREFLRQIRLAAGDQP